MSLDDNLDQLLTNLRLKKIKEVLPFEMKRAMDRQSSYNEFLARLLREQYLYRQERSLIYRVEQAKLPQRWSLETFPFKLQAGVSPKIIHQLAELEFVARAENIVFIGDTGVGKSGLATGILLKALTNGYRGLFIKAQDLFD